MESNETELVDALHETLSRATGLRELLEALVSGAEHAPLGRDAMALLAEAAASVEEAASEALSVVPGSAEGR